MRTIRERFSCRYYKPEPIAPELLAEIALAGAAAPSAHNRQPWHIVVITNPELLKEMDEEALAGLARQEDQANYNYIQKRGGKVFYGAPCLIVVAIDPNYRSAAFLDCGIVGENMVLAAASLGINSVFCGFAYHAFKNGRGEEFSKRLGFPEGYVFGCSILLGYAEKTKAPHVPDPDKISYLK